MSRAHHPGPLLALALAVMALALWHLSAPERALEIRPLTLGGVPATVFRQPGAGPAPVVVIAHGFAGSRQLMAPFASTLARSGLIAVTFDLPGHGRNTVPLPGSFMEPGPRDRALDAALAAVTREAVALGDSRLALLGHSMGSHLVVRHARDRPEIGATVAVSLFTADGVSARRPLNLLIIDGALEPGSLREVGVALMGQALPPGTRAEAGVTYGDFRAGTARRLVLAGGVEHIGVLFSATSLREARDWLLGAFALDTPAPPDRRPLWLLLLFAGLALATRPLVALLPRLAVRNPAPGLPWRLLLPVLLLPAVLVPVLLWRLPFEPLPVLLADYLVLHFGVLGVLMLAAGTLAFRGTGEPLGLQLGRAFGPGQRWPLLITAGLVAVAGTLAIALPLDRFLAGFWPVGRRWVYVAVMLAGTLPYFLVDEWLTRGRHSPPWAWAVSKVVLVCSLLLAFALNPNRLFFLLIIVPAMVFFFLAAGLLSRWVADRTAQPLVAGAANALVFAWAIAVTFPIVGPGDISGG